MSKILNRVAPQDEVLLETDIGTMIPSAEQLAEERVTRFNADKEIRLRVKALEEKAPDAAVEAAKTQAIETIDTKAQAVNTVLDGKIATANTAINEALGKAESAKADAVKAQGEASKSAEQAAKSASNASKSAEQAEQAKTAIGNVGERLDAVEVSVAERTQKLSRYISSLYDYKCITLKLPSLNYRRICHDGVIAYDQYDPYKRLHISSSGKVTEIARKVSSAVGVFKLTIVDAISMVTRQYETETSGAHYITTISGIGDDVAVSRVKIDALPTDEMASYSNLYGIALENGFIVLSNGIILSSNLKESGTTINCSATIRPHEQLIKVGVNLVKYLDSSTKKITIMTLGDDGAPTFEIDGYTQEAQTSTLWYSMLNISGYPMSALKINKGSVLRNNGNAGLGYFYTKDQFFVPYRFYGASRSGIICNGKDLFVMLNSSNNDECSIGLLSFGVVGKYDKRNIFCNMYDDALGNLFIFETAVTIYEETTEYVHVFRKK